MAKKNDPYKKFKKLPKDWRSDMLSRKGDDLKKEAFSKLCNLINLRLAKAADENLARIKEELATATEMYRTGEKENLLSMEFIIEVLRSQGDTSVSSVDDFIRDHGGR